MWVGPAKLTGPDSTLKDVGPNSTQKGSAQQLSFFGLGRTWPGPPVLARMILAHYKYFWARTRLA